MSLAWEQMQRILQEADCLCDANGVEAALEQMAKNITAQLHHKNPLVYAVMNGGLITAGRLLPKLKFPLQMGYLHATRYGHATTGGQLQWLVRPSHDLHERTVLIIDDILDVGGTLDAIMQDCLARGAAAVFTAVLVNKQHKRKARPDLHADFVGLEIPDRFLFGCGMDYQGYWRNADGIYAVKDL